MQTLWWGRERSACHVTPDMRYENEGDWQRNAQKIRVDGTDKNASMNDCISCTLVCVLIAWVLYLSLHSNINTRYLEVLEMFIFNQNKTLTAPLRTVVKPESLKILNDGIQQERRVRQHRRTESLKALNDGISTRRSMCRSLVGTTTTIYVQHRLHMLYL